MDMGGRTDGVPGGLTPRHGARRPSGALRGTPPDGACWGGAGAATEASTVDSRMPDSPPRGLNRHARTAVSPVSGGTSYGA